MAGMLLVCGEPETASAFLASARRVYVQRKFDVVVDWLGGGDRAFAIAQRLAQNARSKARSDASTPLPPQQQASTSDTANASTADWRSSSMRGPLDAYVKRFRKK